MLRADLPARVAVASDFTFLKRLRLAGHYGLPPVGGSALRRTVLPLDSPRGGFLTQAGVLKVTANGTTTSPILRKGLGDGADRRQAAPPPPPRSAGRRAGGHPPGRPPAPRAIGEAPIRGLVHARLPCEDRSAGLRPGELRHLRRSSATAIGPRATPRPRARGSARTASRSNSGPALAVDPSATLSDGRTFHDVRELRSGTAPGRRAADRGGTSSANWSRMPPARRSGSARPVGGGSTSSTAAPPRAGSGNPLPRPRVIVPERRASSGNK